MTIDIIYPSQKYFKSFHEALAIVAREQIYLEMIEAPPLEKIQTFQGELIKRDGPVYYAVDGEKVIGWCDVFVETNPRLSHRGSLGMGILPEYRGRGIGTKLLAAVLMHAKKSGLEKIELHVYTGNTQAIALYKKLGFEQEGLIQKYRKLADVYFDCIIMGKFL